jgi:hypothetical protein
MQHPFEHDITALAYDLVEGAERDTLLEHLASCDQCRALYDGYRDEQVTVRDAIVRDARSGAAEAKALETTLRFLDGGEVANQKGGRLIRFPLWLIAVEVAAMLVVSIGLIFLLSPEEEPTDEVVSVPDADRAPAVVESGVAYVRDDAGAWKAADAVPVDEWVSTGPDKFALKLSNGSRAELEPDSVFKISYESEGGQPIVYMLRGDGVVDNFGGIDALVRSGDAGFYAMPGARLSLACEGDEGTLRSWSAPAIVRARVVIGDVLLWNQGQPGRHVPLRAGEVVEWQPSDMRVLADGQTIYFDALTLHATAQKNPTPDVEADFLRQIEFIITRYEDLEKRVPNGQWQGDFSEVQRLRAERVELAKAANTQVVTLIENDVTLIVSTDGETLTLTVKDASGTTTHEKNSLAALKAAVTERVAEMLDGIEIKEVDGKFELAGANAEAQGEGKQNARATFRVIR